MSGNFPLAQPSSARHPRSARWIALLFASALFHLVAFNWAEGHLALPSWRTEQADVIVTQLHPAPTASETPKVQPAPAAPKRKPKPRRPAPPQPVLEAVPELPAAGMEVPGTSTEPAVEVAAVELDAPPAPEAQENAGHKLSPPPSAELEYDVQARRDGQQWYGKGVFRWESAGNAYRITGEASITFLFKITVLNFMSEGVLNEAGIAPVLYSEKPWRKSMTNTHFQHANRTITFSASQASYPYQGGEQDRASIMWQMAAIGRGDPAQFSPGTAFDIVVAGARDADTWRIQVVGLEEMATPLGTMAVWHVARAPRPGTYDQKIDFWLAPEHEWYPVRLRYTYANDDFLDMSLTGLTKQGLTDTSASKQ